MGWIVAKTQLTMYRPCTTKTASRGTGFRRDRGVGFRFARRWNRREYCRQSWLSRFGVFGVIGNRLSAAGGAAWWPKDAAAHGGRVMAPSSRSGCGSEPGSPVPQILSTGWCSFSLVLAYGRLAVVRGGGSGGGPRGSSSSAREIFPDDGGVNRPNRGRSDWQSSFWGFVAA